MIVHKFGGTSVAEAERILHAAELVARSRGKAVVVVSALAGVTDRLATLVPGREGGEPPDRGETVEALRRRHLGVADGLGLPEEHAGFVKGRIVELFGRLQRRLDEPLDPTDDPGGSRSRTRRLDAVTAVGEDLSVELMAAGLRRSGISSQVVDARTVVRTDAGFGRAVPDDEVTRKQARERLVPHLERGTVPVLQGFVGATADGITTTLGRGGSDFTAAMVGAALGAEEVFIWTDVDGVLSGDPRLVPEARVLREIGYEEAVELAYFGAKVIHPAAAKHAVARGLTLRVRNSFRPDSPGTWIRPGSRDVPGVAAVARKEGVVLFKVRSRPLFLQHGFLARVFGVLSDHAVPVDLVATSHTSTGFTVDREEEVEEVVKEVETFAEVEVVRDLATVTVVGRGILEEPGIAAQVFAAVKDVSLELISQASDVSLSMVASSGKAPEVVRRLHRLIDPGRTAGSQA